MLITFEGTEGAGKSTLIRLVEKKLKKLGYQVTVTREPGGNALGEKIRSIILNETMNRWTELFLYEAVRSEHLEAIILPALRKNHIVLCDRFTDSTLAYQGYARGISKKIIQTLNTIATQGLQPDLTILHNLDPKIGLKRAKDPNRFEAEGVQFQTKVQKGFLAIAKKEPRRFKILNVAQHSPEELCEQVLETLKKSSTFKKQHQPSSKKVSRS
jgi:dTMP kinase